MFYLNFDFVSEVCGIKTDTNLKIQIDKRDVVHLMWTQKFR